MPFLDDVVNFCLGYLEESRLAETRSRCRGLAPVSARRPVCIGRVVEGVGSGSRFGEPFGLLDVRLR